MTETGGAASTSAATLADLPRMPPIRDARVNARMVRVLFYLPGFLALLLLKGGAPQGFGVTVEMLMLSSVAAIVAGLLIGAGGAGKRDQDAASETGVWAGQVAMDLMAFVPLLVAVPPLFHTLTQIGSAGSNDPNNYYGASELIPAAAIIPWAVYELAGYSTLSYFLSKTWHVLFVVVTAAAVVVGYMANRNGWYTAELTIDGTLTLLLAVMTVYGIMILKERQEQIDRLTPPPAPKA